MTENQELLEDVNLDETLSAPDIDPDELEGGEEFDPVFAELTDEEKALLVKIDEKRRNQDHIIQTFKELAKRPSDAEIEQFKSQIGEVYLTSFSETENFLFRPLKRLEWRALMNKIAPLDDMKKAEAIVMKGILWPSLNQQNINVLAAGTVDTLRELILQASNFMPAEYAMQLVRKL